jgi:hypothetical protein
MECGSMAITMDKTTMKDLLLADLEHFGESRWRNEEVGEKRFDFFVTLVTAVAAGLVVLANAEGKVFQTLNTTLHKLAGQASLALLIFGLLTYFRMLHRDWVTTEFNDTTDRIRRLYIELYKDTCPELEGYVVPLGLRKTYRNKHMRIPRPLRAGYAQTIAVIDGMLLLPVLAWWAHVPKGWALFCGFCLASMLLFCATRNNNKDQRNKHDAKTA